MKTKHIIFIILGVVIVVPLLFVGIFFLYSNSVYNKSIKLQEGTKEQWANVEATYQRRADLIPNLVKVVKAYAEHEQQTLTEVVEARSRATSVTVDPTNLNKEALMKFQQAQDGLSSALSRLLVVVEKYPDLKANQNFQELQAQLEGTENRITVARMKYNESVKEFNSYIRGLFKQWALGFLGKKDEFPLKEPFVAAESAKDAPDVGDYL